MIKKTFRAFPSSRSCHNTQVQPNWKIRHFGMDAEIQPMDCSQSVVQMLDSGNMPTRSFMFAVAETSDLALSLPSLDAGFRYPCRNDGPQTFVCNDESRNLGTNQTSFGKLFLTKSLPHFVRPDFEACQCIGSKRMDNRYIGCIAAPCDQHTTDARRVVAWIKGVPVPTEEDLEPSGEIHSAVRWRQADVTQIAGAVSSRDIHAAAEGDR